MVPCTAPKTARPALNPTPATRLTRPQSRRALAAVHVVALLLDAEALHAAGVAMRPRDVDVAAMAAREGKALVVALTKADAVPGGRAAAEKLRGDVAGVLEKRLTDAGRVPVVLTAALRGEGLERVMEAAVGAYARWNRR
jgi:GTP-binding protein